MDKTSRSMRRAQKDRMKNKAKRIFKSSLNPELYADNLAHCSCYWCGNPTKHTGCKSLLTFKDKKCKIWLDQEIKDLTED